MILYRHTPDGEEVIGEIKLVEIYGRQIRLGFECPPEVKIARKELMRTSLAANGANG